MITNNKESFNIITRKTNLTMSVPGKKDDKKNVSERSNGNSQRGIPPKHDQEESESDEESSESDPDTPEPSTGPEPSPDPEPPSDPGSSPEPSPAPGAGPVPNVQLLSQLRGQVLRCMMTYRNRLMGDSFYIQVTNIGHPRIYVILRDENMNQTDINVIITNLIGGNVMILRWSIGNPILVSYDQILDEQQMRALPSVTMAQVRAEVARRTRIRTQRRSRAFRNREGIRLLNQMNPAMIRRMLREGGNLATSRWYIEEADGNHARLYYFHRELFDADFGRHEALRRIWQMKGNRVYLQGGGGELLIEEEIRALPFVTKFQVRRAKNNLDPDEYKETRPSEKDDPQTFKRNHVENPTETDFESDTTEDNTSESSEKSDNDAGPHDEDDNAGDNRNSTNKSASHNKQDDKKVPGITYSPPISQSPVTTILPLPIPDRPNKTITKTSSKTVPIIPPRSKTQGLLNEMDSSLIRHLYQRSLQLADGHPRWFVDLAHERIYFYQKTSSENSRSVTNSVKLRRNSNGKLEAANENGEEKLTAEEFEGLQFVTKKEVMMRALQLDQNQNQDRVIDVRSSKTKKAR